MLFHETLIKNTTTDPFQVTGMGFKTYVTIIGTFDSETVTLHGSKDKSTYAAVYDEAAAANVTFTASASASNLDLPPGYYRFVSSNGAGTMDVDVYVDGRYVTLNV